MEVIHKTRKKALVLSCSLKNSDNGVEAESLEELELLAETLGIIIDERIIQTRDAVHPTYYIGRGKIEEVKQKLAERKCELVIVNDDLSPAQLKNVTTALGCEILDRSGLILDIFALRARTKQAKLQVEVARLQYLLPRLTRQWKHLERQVGGAGLRGGPGEKQLEIDRRIARKRIKDLSNELERIEKRTTLQSSSRNKAFRIALVGYTNSGKSTLFNLLTKNTQVVARDQLFTTLDTTIRKYNGSLRQAIIISDTVGFINKLPSHLLKAFITTLKEAIEADVILHVVDSSCSLIPERIEAINTILEKIETHNSERFLVFNKIDKLEHNVALEKLKRNYPEALFISALHKRGLEEIKNRITSLHTAQYITSTYFIPSCSLHVLNKIYLDGNVVNREDSDHGTMLTVKADTSLRNRMHHLGIQEVKRSKLKG